MDISKIITCDSSGIQPLTICSSENPDDLLAKMNIPLIAEITPEPDPVYGHTFTWPAQEVEQFLDMQNEEQGEHSGGQHG